MDIEADLARIALQEERLRFPRFDADVAWELGTALKRAAEIRECNLAIDISTHGQCYFYHAMRGVTPDNADWIRRKRNVTLRFFRSSYAIGLVLKRDQTSLQAKYGLGADFMAHGGSFPLRIAGSACIGAVTISGLPQRQDHDLLTRILADFLAEDVEALALAD